jgi:hypothetical protein
MVKRKEANWIGYILRRNCLLKHVIDGKIERTGEEAENVRRFWTILTKREDNWNLK